MKLNKRSLSFFKESSSGSATITALIVVGVASVLLSGLIWRQEIQMRVLENSRDQTQVVWLQRSAVDFARLILVEDQKNSNYDHLGEIWAIPLVESKLADFLKNTDVTDEVSQVVLVGSISDAQALFNITNLWDQNFRSINRPGVEGYERLLSALGLDSKVAQQTAQIYLEKNSSPIDLASVYSLAAYQTPEMRVLSSFITLLPAQTKINVNTASSEVLMAVIPGLSRSAANSFVQQRTQKPINTFQGIISLLSESGSGLNVFPSAEIVDFKSEYWHVNTEISIKDSYFKNMTLIRRSSNKFQKEDTTQIIWSRVNRG